MYTKKYDMKKLLLLPFLLLILNVNAQTALELDGLDDYLDFGNNPVFTITDSITVEAKVKFSGTVIGYEGIVSNYEDDGTSNNGYWLGIDQGYALWYIGAHSGPPWGYFLYSNDSLNDGSWHHFAGVFDGDSAWLYIDGVLDTAAQLPNASLNSSNGFTVGTDFDSYHYNGAVDDLRIWNATRSGIDIAAYKDSCLTGNENDLVAYYQFEQGAGTLVAHDLTPAMNDGDLINMNSVTSWVAGNHCLSSIVGVTQNNLDGIFNIYPNPTSGVLSISLEEKSTGSLRVLNSVGQVILKDTFEAVSEFDIVIDRPSGLYFLQLEVDGQMMTKKVIKQ